MTSLFGQAAGAGDESIADEIPDELFATLPDLAPADAAPAPPPVAPVAAAPAVPAAARATVDADAALFATLPALPSINGFASRLDQIQSAIEEAKLEAAALRAEIHQKATALRALAGALEATI